MRLIGVLFMLISYENLNSQLINSNYFITNIDESISLSVELKDNKIEFYADFLDFENDLVVLKYQSDNYQHSIIVPAKNNSLNQYFFVTDSTSKIPFVKEEIYADSINLNNSYLQFGGNDYLEQYNAFISATEEIEYIRNNPQSWVRRIIEFSENTGNSQIAGYLLYSTYIFFKSEDIEFATEIESYTKKHKGVFFEKINPINSSGNNKLDCTSHSIDTLIVQSHKNTIVYPEYYVGEDIIVLVYWATWCGPCKPILKELINLKTNKYLDAPVTIFAISIDDDVKKYVNFISKKESNMDKTVAFMDNGCMQQNYNITQIPEIFIYDFNGNLVSKNTNVNNVEAIVDSIINNR